MIKAENEALLRGEQVAVSRWEDHRLHIIEHSAKLDPDIKANPQAYEAVVKHIEETYQLWATMSREDPDALAARGVPPLPQASQVGQQAMMMRSQMPGGPQPQPAQQGPGPQQVKQPETEPGKAQPGPKAAPPGPEPSQGHPSQPQPSKPARNPMDGQPVTKVDSPAA